MQGLIHIYTGDGKGKTTAAVGLGLRAWGRGMKVLMVQFLKGLESGEQIAINKLGPDFVINHGESFKKFTWDMDEEELCYASNIQKGQLDYARKEVETGSWDILILDEIMAAITNKMIPLESVIEFVENKPEHLELVLTGRDAPNELIELADYVTKLQEIKHPMYKGIPARKGIEL